MEDKKLVVEVAEVEDVVGLLLVVVVTKSPFLYRIHIPGAGIRFPLKVNAAEVPYVAPSPVYAMVVTTVDPTVDAQYVEEGPPFTAGVVRVLKPGSQQTAVVSAPDIPTTFLFQPLGQIPGEK